MKLNKQYQDILEKVGRHHFHMPDQQPVIDLIHLVAEQSAKICEMNGQQKCADEIRNFYDVKK
jgi:hypothetical protein